jgi:hypothetical protein
MIRLRPATFALCLMALAAVVGPARTEGTAVVELFTSQGCSSCPPAARLLGRIADAPGVIALSLHVDYWDGLGWADPFGSAVHSARQRRYAETLEDGNAYTSGVYTPQIVVDGRRAVVGHDAPAVRAAVRDEHARADAVQPRIDSVRVMVPAGDPGGVATVWLAAVDRRHDTRVERGENRGRELVNHRVVRSLERLGAWSGARVEFPIDPQALRGRGRDALVILVQRGRTGAILGAAEYPLAP